MTRKPEFIEDPEAWRRFNRAMRKVLAVPHADIQKRIEAERAKPAANPNRRGPTLDSPLNE